MDLIETVHKMHNLTTQKEKIFIGKLSDWLISITNLIIPLILSYS